MRILCCYYCKAAVYSNNDDECSQSAENYENTEDIEDPETGNYTGSNISKPPTKWEAPNLNNPSAPNDKQNDGKPIKN